MTVTGAVVPIPTSKLGTTLIVTISPSSNPWVVVSAADTLVNTVLVTLSTSPVTWSKVDVKKYRCVFIPATLLAFDLKNNPSLSEPRFF